MRCVALRALHSPRSSDCDRAAGPRCAALCKLSTRCRSLRSSRCSRRRHRVPFFVGPVLFSLFRAPDKRSTASRAERVLSPHRSALIHSCLRLTRRAGCDEGRVEDESERLGKGQSRACGGAGTGGLRPPRPLRWVDGQRAQRRVGNVPPSANGCRAHHCLQPQREEGCTGLRRRKGAEHTIRTVCCLSALFCLLFFLCSACAATSLALTHSRIGFMYRYISCANPSHNLTRSPYHVL